MTKVQYNVWMTRYLSSKVVTIGLLQNCEAVN